MIFLMICYYQVAWEFSIAQLNILLYLHLQPIKTVIYSHSNKESCQDGLPA